MTVKDFHSISTKATHDLPHRAMSRAPADHNVTMTLLGLTAAAIVLGILWVFYAYA